MLNGRTPRTFPRWMVTAATAVLLAAALPMPFAAADPRPVGKPPVSSCLYTAPSLKTPSARLCIRKETFARDLCGAIAEFAEVNELPPAFFARLIWKESLFDPQAVSPKGAEGIAQFMPGTARLRGLSNAFDVLAALKESAEYLDDLRDRFGNLGLAAAAYNAGEARLSGFLAEGGLPYETRDYVLSITAHAAEDWRDNPPKTLDIDLDKEKPFLDACVALADTRRLKELSPGNEGTWQPWGVQVAAHFNRSVAHRLFAAAVRRLPASIRREEPLIVRERNAHIGSRARYAARIGRQSRSEADKLCGQIRAHGGACVVLRN